MARTYLLICGNDLCGKEFESENRDKVYCCTPCFRDHTSRTVKRHGASKIHKRTAGVKSGSKKYQYSGL